ncbi:MAG: protein-disulfide reductase DsbD domain-containing protein [Acidobacteriota bacterium]
MRRCVWLLLFLAAPRIAWSAASPWSENEQSRVRLITPWQVAPRNGDLRMGLHFRLSPGWHVYWKNSGDAGFPPVVVFREAPGLGKAEKTELLWPAPQRFELPGNLVAFGYEDEVVYPVSASLRGAGDRVHLEADVDYLVCEVDCIPYRYTLALDQPLGEPVIDAEAGALVDRWWNRLPDRQVAGVSTDASLDGGTLEVRVHGARPGDGANLFLESHDAFDPGKPVARTTDDGVVYRVPLKPREAGKMPSVTNIAWTVTDLAAGGRTFSLEASRQVGPKPKEAEKPPGLLERPAVLTILAAATTLLALAFWGLLGSALPSPYVQALGFAAGAATVGVLYALSRQIRPEQLAAVELALLALALVAWLRHRNQLTRRTR